MNEHPKEIQRPSNFGWTLSNLKNIMDESTKPNDFQTYWNSRILGYI